MINIPEAKYDIIQKGIIRNVCLTRHLKCSSDLPNAEKYKIETTYGIKDKYDELIRYRRWNLRFYRIEPESFTKYEIIIIFVQSFLIYNIFIIIYNIFTSISKF